MMGLRLVIITLLTFVNVVAWAMGAGSTGTPSELGSAGQSSNTNSSNGARPLPSTDKRKCLPQMKNWVADDQSNSIFFMFENSPSESCKAGYNSRKDIQFTKSATDANRVLKERFSKKLGTSVVGNMDRCADDSDPNGKDVVTKYYMANARLQGGMERALESMAAIDATLPTSLGGRSDILGDHQRSVHGGASCSRYNMDEVCARLQACPAKSEDVKNREFSLMAAKVWRAATRLKKIELLENSCRNPWNGWVLKGPNLLDTKIGVLTGNETQIQTLSGLAQSPAFEKLRTEEGSDADVFPHLKRRILNYLKNPRGASQQDKEILTTMINEACSPRVLADIKGDLLRNYPVIGQSTFQKEFNKPLGSSPEINRHAQLAMAAQLKENRKALERLNFQFDQAAQCVYGTNNGRIPCSARQLNETLAKTLPLPDQMTGQRSFNEGAELLNQQQCVADLSGAQNQANDILAGAAMDIVLLAGSGGVAAIGRGGAIAARMGLSATQAVTRAGQINMAIDSAWAARSAANIASTCIPKPKDVTLVASTATANQCPMLSADSVKDTLDQNSCMEAVLTGSMDIVPVGLAAAVAIKNSDNAAAALARAVPTSPPASSATGEGLSSGTKAAASTPAAAVPAPKPTATPKPAKAQPKPSASTADEMAAEMERLDRGNRALAADEMLREIPTAHVDATVKHEKIVLDDGRTIRFNNGPASRDIAVKEGRLLDNAQLSDLKPGKNYNFTLTADGKWTFGEVNNNAELGVKHLLLANGRDVKAAGEMRVLPDGTIEFNLQSGTFTIPQKQAGAQESDIAAAVKKFMASQGSGKVKYAEGKFENPQGKISADELKGYCQSSAFTANNGSLCKALDIPKEAPSVRTASADVSATPSTGPPEPPKSSAQSLPDLSGKSRSEAYQAIEDSGFSLQRTVNGSRQYQSKDGSVLWVTPEGKITREGPQYKGPDGRATGTSRYDQNGNLRPKKAESTEVLRSEPLQSRSSLTQFELEKNARLEVRDKAKGLEDLLGRKKGSLSRDQNFIDELARIEKQYPTTVSTKPVAQRTREEQQMLLRKREALRKLGLKDDEIQKGMDSGYFGVAEVDSMARVQMPAVRFADPEFARAATNGNLTENQRYISFEDSSSGIRMGGVIESVGPRGEIRVFDGVSSRMLTPQEFISARPSATSAKQYSPQKTIQENFPPNSPTVTRGADQGFIENNIPLDPPFGKARVVQSVEDRKFAVQRGLIRENVPVESLEKGKSYTYVITADGSVVYGQVDNAFEYGVKHIQLANGRPVVGAGELRVNADGTISFNLESGSFSRSLIQQKGVSEAELQKRVQAVLQNNGAAQLEYTKSTLLPKDPPNRAELTELCRQSMISTFVPACKNLDSVPVSYAQANQSASARPADWQSNARSGDVRSQPRVSTPEEAVIADRNGWARFPTAEEQRQVQAFLNPKPVATRSQRVLEPVPTMDELTRNSRQESVGRLQAMERELGRRIVVKKPNGVEMGRAELAGKIDDIEARFPTTVSRKPFSERSATDRTNLIAKMRELKKLGMSDDDIRFCLRNGFCGNPPSVQPTNDFIDEVTQLRGKPVSFRLKDGQLIEGKLTDEISDNLYVVDRNGRRTSYNPNQIDESSLRAQMPSVDLAKMPTTLDSFKPQISMTPASPPPSRFEAMRTPGTQAQKPGFFNGRDGQKTVPIHDKILPAKRSRPLPGKPIYRAESEVAAESAFMKDMSDRGWGPKYYGSYKDKDGNFHILTEHMDGVDFNVNGAKFKEQKAAYITEAQLNEAERIALEMTDAGYFTRDLQFMVTPNAVRAIDPERFEFTRDALRIQGRRSEIQSEFRDLRQQLREVRGKP